MNLDEYQERAIETCMPTCKNLPYMLFNLQGEVGELSGKVAKLIRKGHLDIDENEHYFVCPADNITECEEAVNAIIDEMGDVLWQLSGLAYIFNVNLGAVAKRNLEKLADRKRRGVIDGNGDNR